MAISFPTGSDDALGIPTPQRSSVPPCEDRQRSPLKVMAWLKSPVSESTLSLKLPTAQWLLYDYKEVRRDSG